MKEGWFKKIWNDPVWSKVISGVIFAIAGAVISLVESLLNDTATLAESFKKVFNYQVNFWIFLAVIMSLLIIIGVIKKINTKKRRIPLPPFVNDFTRGTYQDLIWKWRWEWSSYYKFYYVTDLNIECPNCHEGLLDLEFMSYRCPKCNASFESTWINGNPDGVMKQIQEDARTKYGCYKEYIGEI